MIIYSLSPTSKSQCFSLALTGVSLHTQTIEYNEMLMPKKINENEGQYELEIFYGNAPQRVKSTLKHDGQLQKTILYYGDYEIEKTINEPQRNLHYIIAPTGIAAIIEKKENLNYPIIYNTFTDYLGSLTHVVESGTLVDEISYDAWGRKRNPANIEEYEEDMETPPTHIFSRGYTFHEHLHEFKLINMNARLYDPTLGRMLSPDNFVTDASNSQDYNSYSYARNNPLKFTDPTGNLVQISQNVGWDDVDYSSPNWIDSEAKNIHDMYYGNTRTASSFRILRLQNGNEIYLSNSGVVTQQVLNQAIGITIAGVEYDIVNKPGFQPANNNDGGNIWQGGTWSHVNGMGNLGPPTFFELEVKPAQGGGGFDDFTQKWDNANSTYGAPFNIAVGLVSEAAKQSATISTAQAFARRELSATLQFAKVAKYAGTASLIGNASQVLNAGYKFYQDPSLGNFTRVGVQFGIIGIEAGLNILLPGSGIMVGIGLNILESQYGDNLYNTIDGR
jgi:RHS repeat-associated protein